ncbi:hypothetical protein V5O48_006918 [Marasmius crinis-equi]|uniref:BCAS3 WD40 domain-containing protein n=1 Tax=Marasmius crinis-equi TaxID=585013 RepID=A0ABR3FIM3_9AGAR
MPSRRNRNGRKNNDNKDDVYQQPTPTSRSPDLRSTGLSEEENSPTWDSSPFQASPLIHDIRLFEEQAEGRDALPTPPLVEVEGFGAEAEAESQSQREAGPVEREQLVMGQVVTGQESPMLLDVVDSDVDVIREGSTAQQTVDNSPNDDFAALIRAPEPPRSPPSSPPPVSTPAPTPEPRIPVSPPRSTKRAPTSKTTSAKSSMHTPTSSQTLAPLPIPLSTTATAVGAPSPPTVSRPVSFGQFAGSGPTSSASGSGRRRSEATPAPEPDSNPVDLGGESMDGTIRPTSGRKRIPARRQPSLSDDDEDGDRHYQQQKPKRRVSYGGQTYTERSNDHLRNRRGKPVAEQPSRSGISRAMGVGPLEDSGLTERAREEVDSVVWARWDLQLGGRRLLFIGYYPLGLQIWDCSELDSVSEILNLPLEKLIDTSTPDDFDFEYAGIIPWSSPDASDSLKEHRPLVGILVSPKPGKSSRTSPHAKAKGSSTKISQLFVYSLSKHCVVKQVAIPGLVAGGGRFDVGDGFLAVSTTIPPALHILSSSTFAVLHKIPSSALTPFSHSSAGHYNSVLTPTSSPGSTTFRRHSLWGTTATTTNYEHAYGRNGGGYNSPTRGPDDNQPIYNDDNSVLLSTSTFLDSPLLQLPPRQPAPVYSVSGRLLAYASSPVAGGGDVYAQRAGSVMPSFSSGAASLLSTGASTARSASMAALGSLSEQLTNFNRGAGSGVGGGITQADLGNAAVKVGGGLLSGMKSLGGMAYKGAVSAASAAATSSSARAGAGSGSGGGGGMASSMSGVSAFANRFFSKSAPAAIVSQEDRRYSAYEESEDGKPDEGDEYGGSVSTAVSGENGWTITVLDIEPILTSVSTDLGPAVVTRFIASKSQPIAQIWFSRDGNSVLVAPRDGQVAHVYGIRSNPVARAVEQREEAEAKEAGGEGSSPSDKSLKRRSSIPVVDAPPLHVYELRRGRTPAAVESASWSLDGRWAGFATRNRTVHVFAVNPYGGRSDLRSHMEALVKNFTEMPALSTDLQPLVRLRVSKHPAPGRLKVPLAFTFLESPYFSESTMPLNLLPAATSPSLLPSHASVGSHSYGSTNSAHTGISSSSPSARSDSMSPQLASGAGRSKNYQDVLVFDPTDGLLSLRRITVNAKLKDGGTSILGASLAGGSSVSNAAGHISKSLPGMGAVGKLAMSVSPTSQARPGPSGLSHRMDAGASDLVGKESTVATWNLKRKRDWSEVKRALEDPVRQVSSKEKLGKVNWLAQAELSTFSKSSRVVPRSIYLTHQFSFQALGEDYHALIRRYQLDVPGPKVEVRKGIEVSAYPIGSGESFVEGGGGFRRDTRRLSSSFDEPLASAIAGELDYSPPQPVLPMLPNGMPGSKPRSFKNSIPIRSLGDGMTEGIERFRREMNKVRSPKLIPSPDNNISGSVPLEFDEEDEDFLLREPDLSPEETSEQPSQRTMTPPTGALDEEDAWVGDQVVDEAETFDHISVVGFLDEEQQSDAAEAASKATKGKKGRKKQ